MYAVEYFSVRKGTKVMSSAATQTQPEVSVTKQVGKRKTKTM